MNIDGIFPDKKTWNKAPQNFGNSGFNNCAGCGGTCGGAKFSNCGGCQAAKFTNASGRQTALETGCKKPLILTSWGRSSIEYRDCMKAYNTEKTKTAEANLNAANVFAQTAPLQAQIEQTKLAAEQERSAQKFSAGQIAGISIGVVLTIGTLILIGLKMTR